MKIIFKTKALIIGLLANCFLVAKPYPIQFSMPEIKIVESIPKKTKDFAFIVPRELDTYIYSEEADYYQDYKSSYFAITCKKGGWDCMRHYEILANGCIPYFVDLDQCDSDTMHFLPKNLILEAMQLDGVSYKKIDHSKFDKKKYYEILTQLLEYTRQHLTTRRMAEYVLNTVKYSGEGKILFLSKDPYPDYMRCCTLIGLKEVLGSRVVDVPKIEHIYKNYPKDVRELYGKGFSYSKIVDDLFIDRSNVIERIKNKEFDLVIYGSIHRGLLYHDLVCSIYSPNEIFYICGEDNHDCEYSHLPNLFLREFDAYRK